MPAPSFYKQLDSYCWRIVLRTYVLEAHHQLAATQTTFFLRTPRQILVPCLQSDSRAISRWAGGTRSPMAHSCPVTAPQGVHEMPLARSSSVPRAHACSVLPNTQTLILLQTHGSSFLFCWRTVIYVKTNRATLHVQPSGTEIAAIPNSEGDASSLKTLHSARTRTHPVPLEETHDQFLHSTDNIW